MCIIGFVVHRKNKAKVSFAEFANVHKGNQKHFTLDGKQAADAPAEQPVLGQQSPRDLTEPLMGQSPAHGASPLLPKTPSSNDGNDRGHNRMLRKSPTEHRDRLGRPQRPGFATNKKAINGAVVERGCL